MDGQTSQANAGSKLNNYRELKITNVSDKEIKKSLGDISFEINAMSFDCIDNKKIIGDSNEVTRVDDAGYASLLFDESRISEFVTISVKSIDNEKLAKAIKSKRNNYKDKRAAELAELEAEETAKDRRAKIEITKNPNVVARQNIEMTSKEDKDKDVV